MTKKSTKTKLTSELKSLVKTEFVQSIDLESGEKCHYTFEDLIKKYNLATATLYRAARAENWKALRDQYNFDLEEKVKEERVKKIARESLKFDDKLLTKANDIIEQVTKYMALNEEALQENKKPFQPNQFLNLTNALLTAQKLGKIAMGEITESINVNTTIKEADAFRGIMELLDSAKEQRLEGDSDPLH
jgi:hypothetical protein